MHQAIPDLRQRRVSRGLRQTELARLTGIDQANISRLEHGYPAYPSWRERIEVALGQ
jgi:transcriptional regulator with XRE-family HTH domain